MTTLPPEAIDAAASAIGHSIGLGEPSQMIAQRALAAAAPSIEAVAVERAFADAREVLAKPLMEAGREAALQGMAAERERIRQLADSVGASYIPACLPGECGPMCGIPQSFSYLLGEGAS